MLIYKVFDLKEPRACLANPPIRARTSSEPPLLVRSEMRMPSAQQNTNTTFAPGQKPIEPVQQPIAPDATAANVLGIKCCFFMIFIFVLYLHLVINPNRLKFRLFFHYKVIFGFRICKPFFKIFIEYLRIIIHL